MGSDDQSGAALIEMAIIMPLLLLLLIGIMEFGGAFKDLLTMSNAAREGTRILSAKGNDDDADCLALVAAVESLTTGASIGGLVEIQIFKAKENGDQDTFLTNTYSFTGTDPSDCTDWTPDPLDPDALAYAPTGRQVLVGGTPPKKLDLVGMRIVYIHSWYTGFPPFSGSFTIDEQTIARLEPEGFA